MWRPGRKVAYGSRKLPDTGNDVGKFLCTFEDWFRERLWELEPDVAAFELPWVGPNTAQITAKKLMCLAGLTELVCYRMGVICYEVNVNSVRSHFLGKVGKQSREGYKRLTIEGCRDRGWAPVNDDEADALAILDFAAHKFKLPTDWAQSPLEAAAGRNTR